MMSQLQQAITAAEAAEQALDLTRSIEAIQVVRKVLAVLRSNEYQFGPLRPADVFFAFP